MPIWIIILIVLIGGTGGHIAIHHAEHGVWNVHQIALAFFLVLNLLINFWEFALFVCSDKVQSEYEETKDEFKGRELERVNGLFLKKIPLSRIFRFSEWTGVWSSYALFDPGYADRGSFGLNIDIANGVTTIIPATLFAFGMTYDLIGPRGLGIVGVVMFWQMFFGTIVYFFQFFHAKRHVGHTVQNLLIFVGSTNGMWFIFPIWGMAVSVQMIYANSYAILQ